MPVAQQAAPLRVKGGIFPAFPVGTACAGTVAEPSLGGLAAGMKAAWSMIICTPLRIVKVVPAATVCEEDKALKNVNVPFASAGGI